MGDPGFSSAGSAADATGKAHAIVAQSIVRQKVPLNEKRQSLWALPRRVLRSVLILNELLVGFTVVAADDAQVAVAIACISLVAVRCTVSTCLRVAAILVAGEA